MAACRRARGKSGLHEATVPGNARAGKPDGKRHREQSARHVRVRVKRWGKSPPRSWQQGRHGKPHREQCRIGASRRLIPPGISRQGCFSPRGPGWQLEPVGDGGSRGMVIAFRKEGTESGLQAVRAYRLSRGPRLNAPSHVAGRHSCYTSLRRCQVMPLREISDELRKDIGHACRRHRGGKGL